MELLDAIYARRAIRDYREDPVPADVIEGIIGDAVYAPSSNNRQAWSFLVVYGRDRLARYADAAREDGIGPSAARRTRFRWQWRAKDCGRWRLEPRLDPQPHRPPLRQRGEIGGQIGEIAPVPEDIFIVEQIADIGDEPDRPQVVSRTQVELAVRGRARDQLVGRQREALPLIQASNHDMRLFDRPHRQVEVGGDVRRVGEFVAREIDQVPACRIVESLGKPCLLIATAGSWAGAAPARSASRRRIAARSRRGASSPILLSSHASACNVGAQCSGESRALAIRSEDTGAAERDDAA